MKSAGSRAEFEFNPSEQTVVEPNCFLTYTCGWITDYLLGKDPGASGPLEVTQPLFELFVFIVGKSVKLLKEGTLK